MLKNIRPVPRTVGFGAGLAALSLLVFSLAGAGWGLLRPQLEGRRVDVADGSSSVIIENLADTQFQSFGWFVVCTGLLALVLGLLAYQRGAESRSFAMLLWVGAVSLAASGAFYVLGTFTAPGLTEASSAQHLSWVPPFAPGVGLLAAPLMSMTAYWSAAFVSSDGDWRLQAGDR